MLFNPTERQIFLLATFQLFRKPISLQMAALLTRLPIHQLKKLTAPLIRRNWLTEQAGYLELGLGIPDAVIKSLVELNNEERIADILQLVKSQDVSHHVDTLAILELFWGRGKVEDATVLAWESLSAEIKEQRYKNALEISAWVALRLEIILEHNDLWASAIDLVLSFDSLDYIYKKHHVETARALELVQEPCRRLGDERRLALALLHLGRNCVNFHQIQQSFEHFKEGFDIVERLGDRDIEGRAAPFYCYYYSLQGRSRESLTHFERIGYPERVDINSVPDPQLTAMTSIQAALTGEFHIAIGALNSRWRRAVQSGANELANLFQAYMGLALLMAGLLDEARLHLDTVLETNDPHEDAFLRFFILRARAYYLFKLGRIHESHKMLCSAVEKSSEEQWHRMFYAFPWVLEMLYYFHRAGFQTIPYYEFQAEMEGALASPSIQSRAVALRIRADEASDPEVVRDLLLTSEKYLIESGNPAELAKTRAQLALLYYRQGDQDQAGRLARQALEARHSMGGQQLPPEIVSLGGGTTDTLPGTINGPDILVRFLDMIDTWIPSDNWQEIFHRIISTTTRFFRAERGAIFTLEGSPDKQRLVFRKGWNFMAEEAEGDNQQIYHQLAMEVIERNRPIIIREPSAGIIPGRCGVKSMLCTPLKISNGQRGMMYYDTLYLEKAFGWFDSDMLTRITESISAYFNRTWAYAQGLNRQQSQAIPVVSELSEQESGAFVTSGRLFQNVIQRADRASLSDAPVLILGETGVGKEVIAKRVHLMSHRRDMPFVAVNLASIPETLLESELFGHEKGAFTGADRQKLGRMELANKGTLFIDEVGDIPKFVQVKLLRALEEMSFVRIGGVVKRNVDFRLIAATNQDLGHEVEAGNFRADLFYRLNVIPIFIPPLRERGDDVIELAQNFLEQAARKYRLPIQPLSHEAKAWIRTYNWPGNVRELRNVMERAVILNRDPDQPANPMLELLPTSPLHSPAEKITLDEIQRRHINRIMEETNQNLTQAAVILGMKRTSLYRRMQKLGLRSK